MTKRNREQKANEEYVYEHNRKAGRAADLPSFNCVFHCGEPLCNLREGGRTSRRVLSSQEKETQEQPTKDKQRITEFYALSSSSLPSLFLHSPTQRARSGKGGSANKLQQGSKDMHRGSCMPAVTDGCPSADHSTPSLDDEYPSVTQRKTARGETRQWNEQGWETTEEQMKQVRGKKTSEKEEKIKNGRAQKTKVKGTKKKKLMTLQERDKSTTNRQNLTDLWRIELSLLWSCHLQLSESITHGCKLIAEPSDCRCTFIQLRIHVINLPSTGKNKHGHNTRRSTQNRTGMKKENEGRQAIKQKKNTEQRRSKQSGRKGRRGKESACRCFGWSPLFHFLLDFVAEKNQILPNWICVVAEQNTGEKKRPRSQQEVDQWKEETGREDEKWGAK